MVTSQKKTSKQPFAVYGKGVFLCIAFVLFGVGISFGQTVDVQFSQATGSDDEANGGNLPVVVVSGGNLLVDATVTVTVTGGSAIAGDDYVFSSPQDIVISAADYTTPANFAIPGFSITDDSGVEPDEDIDFSLSSLDVTVNLVAPTTTTYTITNDDDFSATILASDDTATESPLTTGEFTVSLDATNNTGSPLTVNFTVGGDATSGSDYTGIGTSVAIPDGSDQATITITPVNDTDVEADETVTVTLAAGTGYTVGAPSSDTVTIESEDVAPDPVATITASDDTATESPLTTGEFTVSLDATNNTGSPITVNFTVGGDATSGSDYTGIGTSVAIPDGSDQATITITPID
ncbi:hypothetical protein J0X14_11010, partial [Muricauda sp. CAU 1633]|uniref:Calx-beta domain-containing protein n=1 Tax=Allomuricauda sp. CAU 1633 TaxID=2816036 RepID=UPI001A8D1B74